MQPFKLHAVLKYREQLEDTARQLFFTTREEEKRIHAILNGHQQELNTLYLSLQDKKEKGTTVAELILIENRITIVRENIQQTNKQLENAQKEMNLAQKELQRASQQKKIIEKVKDHQNLSYKQYLDKKERAMLDELAVLFHKR